MTHDHGEPIDWFKAQGIEASDDQILAFRDTVIARESCDHGRSWTGIDDTPLGAPVKAWRCDDCGHEQDIAR